MEQVTARRDNGARRAPIVNLDQIEETIAKVVASDTPSKPAAIAEVIEQPTTGEIAAAAVEDYANRAADHFIAMGDQAMGLAQSLKAEFDALAEDVRRRGASCAKLLSEFTQLTEESGHTVSGEREKFANFPRKPSQQTEA